MKESQEHQAFAKWLDTNKIPYVHSRTDKRHTNTIGDCDFYCFLAGRVLGVEFKSGRNKLSVAQEKRIAYLRQAGNTVRIAYSCGEAILAVSGYFGVVNAPGGPSEREKAPSVSDVTKSEAANGVSSKRWIARIGPVDYVFLGDHRAGGLATKIRIATPSDLINLPRR